MLAAPLALALGLAQIAAATSAARPSECAPLEAPSAANVWERAKSPSLRRYCDLLASASAKLAIPADDAPDAAKPEEARAALVVAAEAARVAPDRAAPLDLQGRALVRLGLWADACRALEAARDKDPAALDDPSALFAWARALAHLGREGEARRAFDALAPRASSLPANERAVAEIEAALSIEARGPASLASAVALLRQAARDARDTTGRFATEALALALDRAGERDEARVVLAGASRASAGAGPGAQPFAPAAEDARSRAILDDAAVGYERDALDALVFEALGAAGARDAWARYLAGPGGRGPWGDHARAHASAPARRAR